ncbi:YjjG family noncanonical pyrimidine nucleotidase [Dyadobacter psychrotolerans]|uniref:Noncanonical pyrimidine nucleotidase, YjjG family n=1 Tax=Dyadobacter psychrotolerans TaxID=2541721 RepID=A0A4R5DNZ0_9BACT|nr:YjjG family noncanonical pyrimidine nucleotidase [Dyadobacter psychrotolerans]TDE12433.1 noncanonical pyrimidine nucleotidase, YjjG family [Dyadobacter psychrotolerans]
MKYKHLFFDLDHTLWDFERNSSESLEDIFHNMLLKECGVTSLEHFIESFLRINTRLWDDFDKGILHHSYIRQNRFLMVFEELGIALPDNHLEIGDLYLNTLPDKKHLLEGALDTLNYAKSAGYQMHIVTNGFTEIQARKIASSGISHFFENVITFENANAKKPDPGIFAYALESAKANKEECIMIGDNWVADVLGAKQFGLDTVYYNPAGLKFDQEPTYDIRRLEELKSIL